MSQNTYKVCIEAAHEFLHIAEQCSNDALELLCEKMYPFAVNAAFACELFLKGILIHNAPQKSVLKIHDLEKLFLELTPSQQSTIKNNFNKRYNCTFETFLKETKDTFINWRYPMEKVLKLNITGLLAFAKALEEQTQVIN